MFGFIRCLFLVHTPRRNKVKKLNSGVYIGYCEHCGAPLWRMKREKWVRDWKRTFGGSYPDDQAGQ